MAHVEHDETTGKLTIHVGQNETYGPLDDTPTHCYLSEWIVRLLKHIGRLEQTSS